MLILQDTPVGDLTRGGQILIHFIRMLGQVMRRFGGALVLAILVATGLTFLLLTQPYERYLGWRFVTSYVATDVLRNGREITNFERADGTVIEVRQEALRASHALQQHADALLERAETSFWIALAGVLLLFVLAVGWIWKSGRRQRKDQWLRGTEIVDELALARLLKERRLASDLHVGQIPLRAGSETLHILFTGSTGTGKSSSLYQLIEQIRRRRERIICYSPVGDFIEYFYRSGKDTILNPFDDRSPSWNLWDECPEPYHYDMLATAIIPDQAHVPDPFWTSAARSVISCLAQETARRN